MMLRDPTNRLNILRFKFEICSNAAVIPEEMIIYNRWGEIFYRGMDSWNGKSANEDAPEGVYVYYLSYRNQLGNRRSVTGEVLLMR